MAGELHRRTRLLESAVARAARPEVVVTHVRDAGTVTEAWARDHGAEPLPSSPTVHVIVDNWWCYGKTGPTPRGEGSSDGA